MLRRALPLVLVPLVLGPAAVAEARGCPAAHSLHPGRAAAPHYRTVAPFEHFSSSRTQVFPHTCTLRELTGGGRARILTRAAPGDYRTPYIAATRDRDELFVYGYGPDASRDGGFVAGVDPHSLRARWRTSIPDRSPPGQWSYPGVLLVHGNGFLYAVYGSVMVKLDPLTGETLARRELPEDPGLTGAAYNGMIVMPDGMIVAKKIERGPCPAAAVPPNPMATVGAFTGLSCAAANALPSRIVVVDPRRLRVVSRMTAPEPVTGRITFGRSGGRDYVYAAGRDSLFRFRYRRRALAVDRGWGPVRYRRGAQRPGTGPGLLGHFVVVQTNFLPSPEPLTVTAVSVHDSRRVFRITPFPGRRQQGSWIVSKPALDAANRTIVTHDSSAGRMAALRLDPRRGLSVTWRRALSSLDFAALVGDPRHREIVIPDLGARGDEVVWLDERTGAEHARSAPLAATGAPGNIVTPGFAGRFYYLSAEGRLWKLRPSRGRASPDRR